MKPTIVRRAITSTLFMGVACSPAQGGRALAADTGSDDASLSSALPEVTVTARRIELIGSASTASEGVVADQELQLAPSYRPGQLLERSRAWWYAAQR